MPIEIRFSDAALLRVEAMLAQLETLDRGRVLEGALRAAAKPAVAKWKQLAPKPGRPGYTGPGRGRKRHGKGLADAIGAKTAAWRRVAGSTLIIGADYMIAPHEHLVELGHDIKPGKRTRAAYRGRSIVAPQAVLRAMGLSRSGGPISRGGRVPGGLYGQRAIESTWGEFQIALTSHIQREIDSSVRAV